MRFEPGFVRSLREDISRVDQETRDHIDDDQGLSGKRLIELVMRPKVDAVADVENVRGEEINHISPDDMKHHVIGREELANGEIALCVMAGTMCLDEFVKFFDTLRGACVKHLWVFTYRSQENLAAIREVFECVHDVQHISGYESYLLTPDNRIVFDEETGTPVLHQLGSGDAFIALRHNEAMKRFVALGGKHVAFVQPGTGFSELVGLIGHHMTSRNEFTCEVAHRSKGDTRHVVGWHEGQLKALSPERLEGVDTDSFSWSATGTCVLQMNAALRNTSELTFSRHRHIRDKKITIEHNRSMLELSEHLITNYVSTR